MKIHSRFFRFIVGIDQACNPLVYGGSEDVTISAQSAYNELVHNKSRIRRRFIDWLFRTFFGQEKHCYKSLFLEIDEFAAERDRIMELLAQHGIPLNSGTPRP